MQAKQKPVERHTIADLGLTEDAVRPTQTVSAVEPAPERQAGEVIEDGDETAGRVVQVLKEAKVI
jgi:electron transfer flavoprotein alpha/beta subunit